MTDGAVTRQKVQRNVIYAACGWTIYIAMAIEGLLGILAEKVLPSLDPWCETASTC